MKAGVPLPYLSDILGHESTSFTAKVYVSLDLEGRANAQSAMAELVKNTLKNNYLGAICPKERNLNV